MVNRKPPEGDYPWYIDINSDGHFHIEYNPKDRTYYVCKDYSNQPKTFKSWCAVQKFILGLPEEDPMCCGEPMEPLVSLKTGEKLWFCKFCKKTYRS